MFSKSRKIISMLIIFVIVVTYMGQTLEAIATTDGLSAITNGFFRTSEMKFNSYFDENGEQKNEKTSEVNEKTTLVLELSPNDVGKGFLKQGKIIAKDLQEGDINFKFSKIKNIIIEEPIETNDFVNQNTNSVPVPDQDRPRSENEELDDTINQTNNITQENVNPVPEQKNTVSEENVTNVENTVTQENVTNTENMVTVENTIENKEIDENTTNTVQNEALLENNIETNQTKENVVQNEISNEVASRSSQPRNEVENANPVPIPDSKEEFINEEDIIEEATKESTEETYEELTAKDFEIEINKDNQINVQNVIYPTKIEVEIEYNQKDTINLDDLYKQINLRLQGTFINIDLERIQTEAMQSIMVGWNYHHEIDIAGKYTQVSPFKLGNHTGMIVESKITVRREIDDEKYLPIKQTTITVDVPEYNEMLPETVSLQATKLMATRGEDLSEVSFNQENWNYDKQNKKLTIIVTNEKENTATCSSGEDEYMIVYRYNAYTEDEKVNMEHKFEVTVEEYSSNENKMITKQWNHAEEIKTQVNDLITYNIGTTKESLNKAKINANYNSPEAGFETEFTTSVNVDILTSDLLEELKITSAKETYIDGNETEIDATNDIYYNKVKFNYNEIKGMLQNGATIEIQTLAGDLLYTLNNDLVQTEENCEVKLASKEKGIYVVFKNIAINGNVSIEFTKAIGKSNYDKATFNSFKKIKSYAQAELKYKTYEETYTMEQIATTKELSNSQTVAQLTLTNNNLTTTAKNDNVEIRIALNNDKQDSDLYINPNFELVFPKYVKNVTVQNVNLMYKTGLKIANYETYIENEIVKMRIELEGIQTTFSESVITNGTNILLNLSLELDEFTPRKQDQIKMYYYNEGVTNYKAQTKWTIRKQVPNGILKETNGFDVAIVNFQAPNGLVTANGIMNYDGKASKIQSIAQGPKTVTLDINQKEQMATMQLVGMNNTENTCTDVVFLGRTPFEGNTGVVTNQDLGTTKTANMITGIEENIENMNMAIIYYSTNENATKDLENSENGWTTNVINWSNIKSYMIVVKGEMLPGTVLKYTYDFKIPAGLYYDEAIYGSFGAFYNNNSKVAVYYESSQADKVGILTKSSLPIKLKLEVDAGDKEEVKTNQYLNYILTVSNEGEVPYSGITIDAQAPAYTYLCEKGEYFDQGNNYYVISNNKQNQWTIDSLAPGETREFSYTIKIQSLHFAHMKIQNSAKMTIGSLNNQQVVSNTVENPVRHADFDLQVSSLSGDNLELGSTMQYRIHSVNTTDEDSDKYEIVLNVPEGMKYKESEAKDIKFDEQTRNLVITVDNLEKRHGRTDVVSLEIGKINKRYITLKPFIRLQNGETIQSTGTNFKVENAWLEVTSNTNFAENQIVENQEVEITYNIKSVGDLPAKELKFDMDLADVFENASVSFTRNLEGQIESYTKTIENNKVSQNFDNLRNGNELQFCIRGKMKNIDQDMQNVILSKLKISGENIEPQEQNTKVQKIKDIGDNEKIEPEPEPEGNYEISGSVLVDKNKEGEDVSNLQTLSGMQVQLLKNGTMIKATSTDNNGNYKFTGLANGSYSIVYSYDKEAYVAENKDEEKSLESYEIAEGTAVSDEIVIADNNRTDVNLSLQEKEKFDLKISQAIQKATVQVKEEKNEYAYADLALAKLEMEPSQIKNANLKLEYKISVENTGNVAGKVSSIVDYMPAGMKFEESENEGWSNGVDGNLYNDSLREEEILPGQTKEITLVLSKEWGEENAGVLSNKAKIAYTENSMRLTESMAGNFASQETIVATSQKGKIGLMLSITGLSLSGMIAMFAYMVKTGKIESKINGKSLIKKVYK